ncbi:MinD/ParA family protein [Fictibacillus terranigra]|uniref:MinD/ParA family protein n=1 Tax=Fictibacillus terranigra TaxID=3058424 RepID=A0ABT8E698_9BACL|nr:MinD/ParA family protein [Fictibacillus sp. CENA-BCM004]MDN4073420.1 MinD/ParA family protein [Fictibacillus sp. CENA-BCM004]
MRDQAEYLRLKVEAASSERSTKVFSVLSGKGGVGKSNVAVNISLALRKLGKSVLLIDLDIGMGNVNLLLGAPSRQTIVDLLDRRFSIWEIIEKGSGDLSFIAGGSGIPHLVDMDERKSAFFASQLQDLASVYQYIVFDIGAGVSETSLNFIMAGHEAVLVTTPEITSVTDAYSMIKMLHARCPDLPISTLINQCKSRKEAMDVHKRLRKVAGEFLHKEINHLGALPFDPVVQLAVKRQKPFLLHRPQSPASVGVMKAAQQFTGGHRDNYPVSYQGFVDRVTALFKKGRDES